MNKVLFPNTALWLLLLIPFVAIGFYPSYWSRMFDDIPTITHVHAFLLSLWVIISIVQPWLIMKRKTKLHRSIGKLSYVLVPLILIAGYILLQTRYDSIISGIQGMVAAGDTKFSIEAAPGIAAGAMVFGVVLFLLLAIFFALAIIYRKSILHHATFMMGAIFTVIDPSVDRIIGRWAYNHQIERGILITFASQMLTIGLLVALAIYQKRKGLSLQPVLFVMAMYLLGYFMVHVGSKSAAWQWFVELILFR